MNFAKLTLKQLERIYVNSGFEIGFDYHDFTREHDLFKYVGVKNHSARYLIGYEDPEIEGQMFASMMYVEIGKGGTLIADYGGCPEFQTTDLEELKKYINDHEVA